jgi:hypothetical protein
MKRRPPLMQKTSRGLEAFKARMSLRHFNKGPIPRPVTESINKIRKRETQNSIFNSRREVDGIFVQRVQV